MSVLDLGPRGPCGAAGLLCDEGVGLAVVPPGFQEMPHACCSGWSISLERRGPCEGAPLQAAPHVNDSESFSPSKLFPGLLGMTYSVNYKEFNIYFQKK